MSQFFQGTTTIQVPDAGGTNRARNVHWWRIPSSEIWLARSIANGAGQSIAHWNSANVSQTAVNCSFFEDASPRTRVTTFAVQNGQPLMTGAPQVTSQTDGSMNFQNMWPAGGGAPQNPLDFIGDPLNKARDGSVFFGRAGQFPVTSVAHRTVTNVTMSMPRWLIGGMDLQMTVRTIDTRANFNRTVANGGWRWNIAGDIQPSNTAIRRTAIGVVGNGDTNGADPFYIVALFDQASVFDVREFLRARGVTHFALNIDGGGTTQGRNRGTNLISSTRGVPYVIAMR